MNSCKKSRSDWFQNFSGSFQFSSVSIQDGIFDPKFFGN
ncbi:hypothetical protein C943_02862 [Mariniradius saccharolyticus AK6]|uniref:Uncharacterized protein n=1 Tax=Mariniradius saccharolyticus AK6 TaxID=1239962 RepID=M7YCR6_9BACT|nr:hypothetical protein C943_02862 [Mariniradius saccharolyticus AK6]